MKLFQVPYIQEIFYLTNIKPIQKNYQDCYDNCMKNLIIGLIVFSTTLLQAIEIPLATGYVNDYANMLSLNQKNALEIYLKNYDEETTNQVFLLTIPSLEDNNLFSYSMAVSEKWQPGVKGKDNGIILLIAKKERKIRIEVGYGLEGKLTDGEAGEIIRYVIAPHFRRGDFERGIMNGTYAITQAISKGYTPSTKDTAYAYQAGDSRINGLFIISLLVGIISWSLFNSGKKFAPSLIGIICLPLLVIISGQTVALPLLIILTLFGGPIYGYLMMVLLIVFIESRFLWLGGGGFGGGFSGGGGGSFGGGGASGGW